MVTTFGEINVGQMFRVGNCEYYKTDDKHALYESGVGRIIETTFTPCNVVEIEEKFEKWEDPKKKWVNDKAQRIIDAAFTNDYWELPCYDN